ncbi:diguanylate cyclase [Enterobacter sp. Bisph1]|uniref:diguanylate cyclase n=1 Tax=Enterobacter sp. Bisph1 TaxID=1274399 RepID=UPI00057BD709|nr:diguanylate cyclase [Enterobacter sp. Bisph1]
MIRTTEEIDSIVADLNRAIEAHYDWLINMFACVVNNSIEQAADLNASSHLLCHIGQWLDVYKPANEDELTYFKSINSTHANMHESGRILMQAIHNKHVNIEHFSDFKHHLAIFSSGVTTYKTYLLKLRGGIDVLTGLPGRRLLDETYTRKMATHAEQNLYLLLLDIDHFKQVNDTYGHLVGDDVLRELAKNLRGWLHKGDTVFRFGGEEFIIILHAPSDNEACRTAHRLCDVIASHPVQCDDKQLPVTVTIGITQALANEPIDVVEKRADAAMYRGKQSGRNRCMFMDASGQINGINPVTPAY